jgi:hypothetical protein
VFTTPNEAIRLDLDIRMLGHWNEVVIQALKQLDPMLPLSHDRAERRVFDQGQFF